MTTKAVRYWMLFSLVCFVVGMVGGIEFSRYQIKRLANTVYAGPVNSFTMCLADAWEKSGELSEDWKGKRQWVLTEVTE